ncbi:MAG: radical SAM protein [Pseudomonadota bacterium]
MADTLFLQFYNPVKNSYYDLCNGFSDTYDLCKRSGDFFWTIHESDSNRWYDEAIYEARHLPIEKGTMYISAVYLNHLYQSYVWAKKYPDINFIVGGPVASEQCGKNNTWNPVYFELLPGTRMPLNLKITGMSVEDRFGVPNFSGKWNLDIPKDIPEESSVYFSYTLDNRCYWRKCIYCNIALHAGGWFRKRTDFHFEFKEILHKGKKLVRLNTGSLTPAHIRELFPIIPAREDLEYRVFMRPAKPENDALKAVLNSRKGEMPKIMVGLGIEFPSNRMLRYARKGTTTQEMLETLSICKENDLHVNGNFILGWNNLVDSDIRELEDFFHQMPQDSMANMQLRWMFAHPYTEIHDQYTGEQIRLGPFYVGFRADIELRHLEINRQACDIVERYSRIKNFKLEGMGNVRNHLSKRN